MSDEIIEEKNQCNIKNISRVQERAETPQYLWVFNADVLFSFFYIPMHGYQETVTTYYSFGHVHIEKN